MENSDKHNCEYCAQNDDTATVQADDKLNHLCETHGDCVSVP